MLFIIIVNIVAIHNKNGKGLLPFNKCNNFVTLNSSQSTIKMEKGYYLLTAETDTGVACKSQSTIKMEKGYYTLTVPLPVYQCMSQSTIKMEKGYYAYTTQTGSKATTVAIHNKNGGTFVNLVVRCFSYFRI